MHPSPVRAIANGTITYSSSNAPGWPGGAFIAERIDSGSFKGKVFFAAMHLKRLLKVGCQVKAGQVIAQALPGYPWLKLGWAPPGTTPQTITPNYGAPDGVPSAGGKAMARLLRALGARTSDPGRGPLYPGLQ
jgi:hypothetical protein